MENQPPVLRKKSIRWEKWTALGTIVMALCALLSSLWQGYSLQQHNQLSLRPYLQLEINADKLPGSELYGLDIYINNNGLGPADVTFASFVLDGKEIHDTAAIWAVMGLASGTDCQFGSGHVQRFYKVADRQMVISALNKGCLLNREQLDFLISRLKIRLVYSSLYGEEFELLWENQS